MAPNSNELLERLYDTVATPHAWPEIFGEVARQLDARSLGVLRMDGATVDFIACADTTTSSAQSSYADYYSQIDPTVAAVAGLGVEKIEGAYERFSAAQRYNSEFFADWAIPNGMGNPLYGVLHRSSGHTAWLVAAYPMDTSNAELEHRKKQLGAAWSDLSRFARLAIQFQQADLGRQMFASTLDALPMAVIAIDSEMRVLTANFQAERLAFAVHGLRIRDCRLQCADPALAQQIASQVRAAIAPVLDCPAGDGDPIVINAAGGKEYLVECFPSSCLAGGSPQRRCALLVIRRPRATGQAEAAALARMYQLTRAESRVAGETIRGLGIERVAARLGLSRSTVRVHLQRVFDKCDVHTQAALTALASRYRGLGGIDDTPV